MADFDGDGRLDFVVLVIGGQAELWKNESASDNHWLIVRLTGTKSNRDGIGARVSDRQSGADDDDVRSATRRLHMPDCTSVWEQRRIP